MVEKIKKVMKAPKIFSIDNIDDFEDKETDLITISVTDEGIGIHKDE